MELALDNLGIAFTLNGSDAEFAAVPDKPLRYRKEIIPVGHHKKARKGQEPIEFTVTEATIDHWVNTYAAMSELGVEVPGPIGHTVNPELRRATWTGFEKAPNKDNELALFAVAEFADEKAAELAKTAQVSLYCVDEYECQGVKFKAPIRHIAFTDYPVIPGLGKFEALAADLVSDPIPSDPVTSPLDDAVISICRELGMQNVQDGTSAVNALFLFVRNVQELCGYMGVKNANGESWMKSLDEVKGVYDAVKVARSNLALSEDSPLGKERYKSAKAELKLALSEVDNLVNDGIITTFVGTKLKASAGKLVQTEGIGLSEVGVEHNDNALLVLSDIIGALKQNTTKVVRFGERTGPQIGDEAKSRSVLANAEKRRNKQRV